MIYENAYIYISLKKIFSIGVLKVLVINLVNFFVS